jgi:hypothetical protein
MSDTSESLADLVRAYLEDGEVALRPDDSVAEARANTCCFAVAGVQLDVAAVLAALIDVAAEIRRRLTGQSGPATFYAWYDDQAGQLRCSLASAPPDQLPFRGPYRAGAGAEVAEEVLRLAVQDPHQGVVPFDEATPVTFNEVSNPEVVATPAPFPVWAVVVR